MRLLLGLLLASTLVAGFSALWMHGQWRAGNSALVTLAGQLATARSQRQNAIGQRAAAERERLIAERQRQDALQQRSAAERQRLNAEQQRQEAVAQRSVAERERRNADQQRQEAVQQRAVAERERRNADQQRQEAVQQRTVAERLRLLSVGRSLATDVARILQRGDRALGSLLALQAFRFTVENGGSTRDPDMYEALRQALFAINLSGHALLGHEDDVRAVRFLSATHLITASDDGTMRRWNLALGKQDSLLMHGSERLTTLDMGQQQQLLVGGGSGGNLHSWSLPLQDGPVRVPTTIDTDYGVSSIALTPAGGLAVGFLDGHVDLWRHLDKQPISAPTTTTSRVHAQPVAAFGEAPTLVWAGAGGGVMLWDLSTPATTAIEFATEFGRVTAIAVDPENHRLIIGTLTGDVAVWDLDNRAAAPVILVGHASRVTSLAVTKQGMLASGSLDNTVRLWNMDQPDQPPITIDHGAWVWSVAFSPDGSLVASAGADRAVRLWPTRPREMAESLCGSLQRNLNADEWLELVGPDVPYQITCDHLPGPEQFHARLD